MENLTVKVEGDQKELILREGQAEPIRVPRKIKIDGDINTVKEYLSKRMNIASLGMQLQYINKGTSIITVDEEKMFILLELDPNDELATVVNAKLEFTTYLDQWNINGKKTFTRKELLDILKYAKLMFDDPDQYETVYKAYQVFDFQAMISASQEDDKRGNRSASVKKEIKTNLPADFILRIPIFKGQGPETFRVEVCYDTTDASIKFWFESVELFNLIEQRKIEIFAEQLAPFQDFVIIRK